MAVISPADLTRFMRSPHTNDVYINRWPLRVVATATIDQVTFTYPVAEITVTSTSGGWLDAILGQMVIITDSGGDTITTGVIRKLSDATTLYLDAKHHGDPGRAQQFGEELEDAQDVTVYDYMPLWGLFSTIRDGIFYKFYDLPYTNQGTNPAPVANIGSWRQVFVNPSTVKAELFFDASDSYDWQEEALTYLWTLPSGLVLTSGVLTGVAITVECDPGFYLINCNVSNGVSNRDAIRPVWVNVETPGDANAPYSDGKATQISSDQQNGQGRKMSLALYGEILDSDFIDGGAIMLSEYPLYNKGIVLSDNLVKTYVGFIDEITREATTTEVQKLLCETQSPYTTLSQIPCAPQAIREKVTPANWTEIETGLGKASFVMWYLLNYHCPNILTLFDFFKLTDSPPPRKTKWNTSADNLGAQVTEIATSVAGNIGSSSDGSLYFKRNPNVEDDGFRNGLDTNMTILPEHLTGGISFPARYRPQIGEYTVYGWVVSGDEDLAKVSIAGKDAQGQGLTKTQGPILLVGSQNELNIKTGNLLALENNPTPEISFTMNRNMDVFDPARNWNKWYALDIPASYDSRGIGFTGRGTAQTVNREWRIIGRGTVNKHIGITLQTETKGIPGETLVPGSWVSGTPPPGLIWAYSSTGGQTTVDFMIDEFGNLSWRPSSGSDWVDIGSVVGPQGEPGNTVSNPAPVPPVDEGDRPPGEDWDCIAATSVADYVFAYKDALIAAIDDSLTPFGFRQAIGIFLTTIIPLNTELQVYLSELSSEYFGTASSVIDTAFSVAVYDALLEILYCNMNSDGQLEDGTPGYQGVMDEIALESGLAWDIITDLFTLLEANGINTAANAMGVETASCVGATCRWTHEWDFVNYGMEAWVIDGNGWGTFVEGVGVEGELNDPDGGGYISLLVQDLSFNEDIPRMDTIEFFFEQTSGSWTGIVAALNLRIPPAAAEVKNQGWLLPGMDDWDYVVTLQDATSANIFMRVSRTKTANYGSLLIKSVTFSGIGPDPFFGRVTAARHEP